MEWLTPWRLRWYPRALLLALTVAFGVSVLGAEGGAGVLGRLGGDFPAFYGAGRIVVEGRGVELYDWSVQATSQAGLHPGEEDSFLAFAYPPFLALAYAPLALLPFRLAYLVHTLLMGGAVYAAIRLLRPMLPRVDRYGLEAFCVAIAFVPLFRSVTGGQNTALTLLLVAAAWRATWAGQGLLAGVALGLMLFKPQFALPLIGLFAVGRHGRALVGVAGTAAGLWAAGAAVGGWAWPWEWWGQIGDFHGLDQAVNAANSVGWLGFAEALLGPGNPVALALGGALTLATVGALVWSWWRPMPLDLRMALVAPGLVLVPPHSMFYDSGLLVLGLAVVGDRGGRRRLGALVAIWLLALTSLAAPLLGFNPLFLVAVATLALAGALLGSGERPPDHAHADEAPDPQAGHPSPPGG